MNASMKRAAGATEKEERRRAILERAEVLFRERDFDEIKMTDLAAGLGLAKGTLYLYFPSKESLFLALLGEMLDASFAYISGMEAPGGAGRSADAAVEAAARAIASGIAADSVLPRLLAELHVVLERNAPYEEALAFKRRLAAAIAKAGAGVAAALPPLAEADGVRFLLYVYAQVVGLVGQTELSPFMRKLCAEPGLELFKLDFEEALFESSRAMLAGILKAARGRGRGEAV
jgi:AcrR family transcriptional regulator